MGRSRHCNGTALQAYAESPGGRRLEVKGRRTQRTNNISSFVVMGGDRKSRQNCQYKTGHARKRSVRQGLGPVQVRTGFTIFGPPPNLEPDFWSGSAPTPNLELDRGPVRRGSGPNLGSELDCSNTILAKQPRYALQSKYHSSQTKYPTEFGKQSQWISSWAFQYYKDMTVSLLS